MSAPDHVVQIRHADEFVPDGDAAVTAVSIVDFVERWPLSSSWIDGLKLVTAPLEDRFRMAV